MLLRTRQRRINDLLNVSHNSEAEREYLKKRISDIFQDSEDAQKVLGELDKEDELNGRKKRRNSDPTSGESHIRLFPVLMKLLWGLKR